MPKRDNGLPRNNGDTSGMREANLSGHGIWSRASRSPQGRSRSDACLRTEEMVWGPESGYGALPEAEEKDPGKFWIT
jgi:hypothetical protein